MVLVLPVVALLLTAPAPRDLAATAEQELAFGIDVARRGLWSEARFRFERAVALDPDNAEALNDLGVALEQQGEFAKAREAGVARMVLVNKCDLENVDFESLVSSLQVAGSSVGNAYLRGRLEPAVDRVREGGALYESLEATGVVPELAIDLVKVGEATGSLDEMLSNVSDFFDDEIETRIQRLLSLVEPLMLVFMGLIVSMLLIAMYLPLFSVLGKLQ